MNVKISINKKFNKETASINLPSSKSISNRVLILSSLANQRCEIQNLYKANDTVLLKKLLQIGNSKTLNCEDAGTTFRFLLTYCSLIKGNWHITGTSRLFNRPYKDLLNVLIKNGAYIEVNELKRIINISGGNLKGGKISIDGDYVYFGSKKFKKQLTYDVMSEEKTFYYNDNFKGWVISLKYQKWLLDNGATSI